MSRVEFDAHKKRLALSMISHIEDDYLRVEELMKQQKVLGDVIGDRLYQNVMSIS